jgi:TetR/AcrR family transcriptional regulator, repressor for neighboring sulfatase
LVATHRTTKAKARSSPKPEAKRAPARSVQRRRAPDEARTDLLDAAEALLSERGPDAVGLRDVAQKAGVSHGLITHYFKTYEGLVECACARRSQRIASELIARLDRAGGALAAVELVQLLLATVREPVHLRLGAWSMLSGRAQDRDFLPGREQPLRAVADAVHRAASMRAEQAGRPAPAQEDIDYAIVLGLSATYGYALGRRQFLHALGRRPTAATDDLIATRLTDMLHAILGPK